ncbi:OLC1v1012163C1 [Oldenlandia corymbosa var. corymbosa]|uniref:Transcription initiation factor IIF subunit alpha n=1 Tax=Oldenlandia corymbosa var. corymbosa TaxID=529605 RepID=A0AAV1DVD2_OLDCO|nr:OLC1v1012163C1 [Oldenlandia corymbosa var. corymbosa]
MDINSDNQEGQTNGGGGGAPCCPPSPTPTTSISISRKGQMISTSSSSSEVSVNSVFTETHDLKVLSRKKKMKDIEMEKLVQRVDALEKVMVSLYETAAEIGHATETLKNSLTLLHPELAIELSKSNAKRADDDDDDDGAYNEMKINLNDGEDPKTAVNNVPRKKVKFENEGKPVKIFEIPGKNISAMTEFAMQQQPSPSSAASSRPSRSLAPFTEEEIRGVLMQNEPVTVMGVVTRFKPKLKKMENRDALAAICQSICVIRKKVPIGNNYIALTNNVSV